jgi:hypothetical protein
MAMSVLHYCGDLNFSFLYCSQVLAFNGQPVKNLKNLATMVENCKDEFLKFDLEYDQVSSWSFFI